MSDRRENKIDIMHSVKIGAILCLICAVIAFVLSFVSNVTAARIAENEEGERKKAIISLFDSPDISYSHFAVGEGASSDSVFAVYNSQVYDSAPAENAERLGYCMAVSPSGFGGDINLMVGLDTEGNVIGVRVVSHSETPGLGSRIENESFLSQFISGAENAACDIISGSTISSRAVEEGVRMAKADMELIMTGGN